MTYHQITGLDGWMSFLRLCFLGLHVFSGDLGLIRSDFPLQFVQVWHMSSFLKLLPMKQYGNFMSETAAARSLNV